MSMISTCRVCIIYCKIICITLTLPYKEDSSLSPLWQMMRYRYTLLLVTLILAGCGTPWLHPREELQTERIQDEIALPSLPSSTEGVLARSLSNDTLDMHWSYSGSLSHVDTLQWTGILLLSGYFGLVDESCDGALQWNRQLSGSTLAINNVSGHLMFGPRNTNNITFTGSNHEIPLQLSFQYMLGLIQEIPPLTDMTLIQATATGYVLAVDNITGRGNNTQFTLTWVYDDNIWTGTLIDHQWTVTHNQQKIEWKQHPDTIAIRYFPERETIPSRDCDMSSDMSFGTCTIAPPAGDAFTSQAPLTLTRETHLASVATNSIYGQQ